MTPKEMIEKLERARAWMERRLVKHHDTKSKRLADIEDVLAALRSRPAPPDDLVALVREYQDAAAADSGVAADHDVERYARLVAAHIALLAWSAPAPVAAPAPVDGASLQSIDHRLRRVQTFCDSMASRARRDEEWRDAERAGEMGALLQSVIEQVATWTAPASETPATEPECAGPFVSAFDCPKCDPRRKTAPETPTRACHGCGYTLVRCYDCKRGGAVACCPDCDHSERSTEPAPETPAPDAMPAPSWPDANNAVRWKPDDVVGHTTVRDADGSLRHEPLTREVADALWKTAEEARLRRVASMPDERAAIAVLFSAWLRLKELGWKEAEYCPKDGTPFDAIEPGSTGVHRCHYDGKWPDGRWWTSDEHDMYPSRPILWRRQEAQP